MQGNLVHVTASNIDKVLRFCNQEPVLGIDTETTALHPKDGKLRLIQIATKDRIFILDAFKVDPLLLQPLFDGTHFLIGHNLAFDLRFLWSVGLILPDGKKIFDTMIAGQLLDAGILPRKSHRLDVMSLEYCSIELPKELQTSNWAGHISDEQYRYAARDAQIVLYLYYEIVEHLRRARLERTMRLEMRCLPGIVWLTMSGIKVNKEGWNTLADRNRIEVENLERALAAESGTEDFYGFSSVNWRSPDQVIEIFNRRFARQGKHSRRKVRAFCDLPACNFYGRPCEYHAPLVWDKQPVLLPDTKDETLTTIAQSGDQLATLLLEYRKHVKLRDTYGRQWAAQFIHHDGRVYSDYRQLGAFSGRMSCTNPNCQQVPHSKEFRCLFIPEDGYKFVISDYSQIELRITVEMSNDPVGMQAYCVDMTDLHKATAELILKVDLKNDPPEKVKQARQVSKSLNFGLIFGAGAETMRLYAQSAFKVTMSPEEAIKLRNAWRQIYQGIVSWQKRVVEGVQTVYTLGGRRRLQVDKFTEKLNTPVQGTGADGLKAAIALCYERRHMVPESVRPVAYVHDELVFESLNENTEEVAAWAKQNMEEGMQAFLKKVPVVAEPVIAESWADK